MKFRTLLLVACMVVVPCTAMVSHRLPGGVRQAVRRLTWDPAAAWLRGEPPPALAGACPDEPLRPVPVAAVVPRATAVVTADDAGAAGAIPVRLTELGALAVECRPLPGTTGEHMAMCRMPVDAGGHLHRVFQATGGDAETAQRRLLVDVEAWLGRTASRAKP
jgi:hypothetical protein